MKKSKNKIIMIVLSATIMSNVLVPMSTLAATNNTNNEGKEEVIYINLNGNGEVDNVYAVNILGTKDIIDYGDYSDIRNMNTTDSLFYSNGKVTGTNSAEKLYYQGTLNEIEIPWNIKINYYLDGKEVNPDNLAGRTGALEIKISITQNEKCNSIFFENYALQSTLTLDSEKCTNIEADGATIANVGSDKQLSYIILPNKGKEIIIKADVKDFEMSSMAINGVKLGLTVDVDDKELLDKVTELTDAIDKLNSGAISVNDGTSSLNNGTTDLSSGVDSLNSGVTSLNDGILKIYAGLEELNSNSKNLTSGSSEVLNALNQISTALNNVDISTENISNLVSASSSIQNGINDLVSAITLLQENTNYDSYKAIMNTNGLNIDSLQSNNASTIEVINNQIVVLTETRDKLLASGLAIDDSQIVQIQTQINTFSQIITLIQGNMASISGTESYLNNVSIGVNEVLNGATTLQTKYDKFNSIIINLGDMLDGMVYNLSTLSSAINTLISEYSKLDSGITDYTNGVRTVLSGYSQIVIGSNNLVNGSSTLKSGAEKLSIGLSELYSGTTELSKGTTELNNQTSNLDIEVTDQINEMIDDLDGTSDEIVSFVSEQNINVDSVQFVIKTPVIENKNIIEDEEQEETLSFWEKLINLFK